MSAVDQRVALREATGFVEEAAASSSVAQGGGAEGGRRAPKIPAAYYGALGMNVTTGQCNEDGLYPEGRVRSRLWRTWLPDAYPSHEWIQMFSGYAPWVRGRIPDSRGYWS
jgi:hypothetical protein